MSVLVLPKRIFQLLLKLSERKNSLHTKSKPKISREEHSAKLLLNSIKRAKFSNAPNLNANTYESLVSQKCSSTDKSKNIGRHQFHKEVEQAINDQIKTEYDASFSYLSMACYYGRTEVALPGCQGFFMHMHQEEHEHAIIFVNYLLMRGGHVKIPNVCAIEDDWKDISRAFSTAAEMEASVKEKLQNVVHLAEKHKDYQLADFIANDFLKDQNESICTMARLYARSKMVNSEVGEYLFDHHLYEAFVKNSKENLMYLKHLPNVNDEKVYK